MGSTSSLEIDFAVRALARLRRLATGPFFTVTTYQVYDINGYTFYIIDQDKKSVYHNSAIRVDAFDSKMQKTAYYSQIEEIWELSYPGFKVPVFWCRWVQGRQGVMKDRYGFTRLTSTKLDTGMSHL